MIRLYVFYAKVNIPSKKNYRLSPCQTGKAVKPQFLHLVVSWLEVFGNIGLGCGIQGQGYVHAHSFSPCCRISAALVLLLSLQSGGSGGAGAAQSGGAALLPHPAQHAEAQHQKETWRERERERGSSPGGVQSPNNRTDEDQRLAKSQEPFSKPTKS